MTKEKANAVYDLLIEIGGAYEPDRQSFVYHHAESKEECREWRFQGYFGFGGKYRSRTNSVDYYQESKSKQLDELQTILNDKLQKLDTKEND